MAILKSLGRAAAALAFAAAGTAVAPAAAGDGLLADALSVSVPVLARPVARHDQIGRQDIRWVEAQTKRLPRGAIVDDVDLIGMTAQRNLAAGRVMRSRDVAPPLAIRKGDLVSIVFQTPHMTLTARGRALEGATAGSAIRVLNAHSKRTIEATAAAPGLVTTQPIGHAQIAEALR